jgi:epoxyqueuosine reductase
MTLKERIREYAESQGADVFGVALPGRYLDYLKQARARLEETGATARDFMLSEDATTFFETLSEPGRSLPGVKSIIVLGAYSLDQEGDYEGTARQLKGKTARTYAYYPVVRQIAENVVGYIEKEGYHAIQGQHVPLKHVAHAIGLGVYGRNGLLLTRDFGSYVALRAVLTDADMAPDRFTPPATPCADCIRCLKACPTGALYAPYKVDPALCINPLSRREEDIPRDLRKRIGTWVCGCDICQEVCPANRALAPRWPDPRAGFDPAHHSSHRTLGGLSRTPDLEGLARCSNEHVMRRNALAALGNVGSVHAYRVLRSIRQTITDDSLLDYCTSAIRQIEERADKQ